MLMTDEICLVMHLLNLTDVLVGSPVIHFLILKIHSKKKTVVATVLMTHRIDFGLSLLKCVNSSWKNLNSAAIISQAPYGRS